MRAVSLYGQSVTDASFVQLATLLTGNGGAWSYGVTPHIQTTYKVIWTTEVSPQVTIGVNPSVTFRTHNGGIVGQASAPGNPLRDAEGFDWSAMCTGPGTRRRIDRSTGALRSPFIRTSPPGAGSCACSLPPTRQEPDTFRVRSAIHLFRVR